MIGDQDLYATLVRPSDSVLWLRNTKPVPFRRPGFLSTLRNARCRLRRRPMMHWDRTKDRDKKCWMQMATHAANSCETSSGQQLPETDNLNDSGKCQWKNWKTEKFWEMSGVEHSWENSIFHFFSFPINMSQNNSVFQFFFIFLSSIFLFLVVVKYLICVSFF